MKLLLVVAWAAVVVWTAWASDDAFITLRTVDNALNGYGLRFNVAERVQAYTHPLWMFVTLGATWVAGSAYLGAMWVSVAASVASVVVLLRRIAVGTFGAVLAVTLLLSSRAFTDYSTSGLENPLTHLLLASFVATWWSLAAGPRRTFWLALLVAAIMINRIDAGLLVLPAFAVAAWQRPLRGHLIAALAGFLPLALWEVFSLIYYGFLFPNTAYAKLSTGVPQLDLMAQAVHYYTNSLQTDSPTLFTIAAALVLTAMRRKAETWPLALGILLYLVYIVRIGGDFMAGRFFAAPFFVAVMVVCHGPLPARWTVRGGIVATLFVARALLLSIPFDISMRHGITDQRRLYSDGTRLATQRTYPLEGRPEAIRGRVIRETRPGVVEWGMIGITGYFAGPEVHILDTYALSDPLLARRPANAKWRIGHFERRVPAGYARSLRTGQNHLESKMLAALYDDILLATRGPLWTRDRWRAILRLNLQ